MAEAGNITTENLKLMTDINISIANLFYKNSSFHDDLKFAKVKPIFIKKMI